jgi:hypothetical protein
MNNLVSDTWKYIHGLTNEKDIKYSKGFIVENYIWISFVIGSTKHIFLKKFRNI